MTNVVLPVGWGIAVFWTRSNSDSIDPKQDTRTTRIMKLVQSHQLNIVFKLRAK